MPRGTLPPAIEDWLDEHARKTAERLMGNLHADAVKLVESGESDLLKLFAIDRARDLKKFCREAIIRKREFAAIVIACESGLLPWNHRISYRNFVPQHLVLSDDEIQNVGALSPGDPVPGPLRKIMATFDERRMLVGHVFYSDDLSKWHLVYFDQRDMTQHDNHWVEGSHMHLVNCVVRPQQDLNSAWEEFHNGNPHMRGALHVKCAIQ